MIRRVVLCVLSVTVMLSFSGTAMAQHGHSHGAPPSDSRPSKSHSMPMKDRPVQSTTIGDLTVTLDIMDMVMHVSMQGMKGNPLPETWDHSKSHAMMVTIRDTSSKEIIKDVGVVFTVVSPMGKKETGPLAWSGDHYGMGFSIEEKGPYKVQLIVKRGETYTPARFTYQAM